MIYLPRYLKILIFRTLTNVIFFKTAFYSLIAAAASCILLPHWLVGHVLISTAIGFFLMAIWSLYLEIILPTDIICSNSAICSEKDIQNEIDRLRSYPDKLQYKSDLIIKKD